MELLSVIVPAYNAEKYIVKCINSIITQTYENLEIIIVDDCSTDTTSIICDELSKKDNRIVVCHQIKNSGISKTRNKGLDIASGKYITFVDSDDYIDKCMYENMMQQMLSENIDFISCDFKEIINGEIVEHKRQNNVFYLENEIKEDLIFKLVGEQKLSCSVWKNIFKKDIIDKNEIRFRNTKIAEDMYFVLEYLICCKNAKYISDTYYNYVIHEGSTMHMIGFYDKKVNLSAPIIKHEIFSKYSLNNDLFYKHFGMEYIVSILRLIKASDKNNFKQIRKDKEYCKYLYWKNLSGLNIKFKIIYIMFKVGMTGVLYDYINRK